MESWSFYFTTCSQIKNTGPTQANADSYYQDSSVTTQIIGLRIQKWITPKQKKNHLERNFNDPELL